MRIPIRVQLGVAVLLFSLVPLAVLAIATWVNNSNFVTDITSQSLALTANLKATQIASDLLLIQSTCATIVSRILVQNALKSYYRGNQTSSNWNAAQHDVMGALASGGYSSLLQLVIYSRNGTGNSTEGLVRATANTTITLPQLLPDGTNAVLGGDDKGGLGWPTALYPNISYIPLDTPDPMDPSVNATFVRTYLDLPLNSSAALFLGPFFVNHSFAMVSLTLPIVDITGPNRDIVLGYMTIVAAATSLIDVVQSRAGLASTGITLIIGPSRHENLFRYEQRPASETYQPTQGALDMAKVKYVFPPIPIDGQSDRHSEYNTNFSRDGSSNFSMREYPAAIAGFGRRNPNINNASSILSTRNENNVTVAVGYARPQSSLVSWLLIVEQTHDEAWAPIDKLRKIVLACVFGTIGLILLVVFPMAHYSVRPIARLRDATEKSVSPPGYTPNGSIHSGRSDDLSVLHEAGDLERRSGSHHSFRTRKGFFMRLKNLGSNKSRRKSKTERQEDDRRRAFKIPGKVQDRGHIITDELTELTTTFNEMADELLLQYSSLEDKVAARTSELELSKRAAEAANESKTLFIANISHELKTPLNGILGMCAVCMGEDDVQAIKQNLKIVYKSGDLLLNLLNDLLTFSKNQIGQQLSLEEKEFRLIDVKTQIITIFMKQVQEGHINFSVKFVGTDIDTGTDSSMEKVLPALGPNGTGRLKDMCLWGDQHRILQVIINLVSNSLKFTPEGGKVEVRIKCLGEAETISDGSASRNSMGSKQSSQRNSRHRQRNDSGSNTSQLSRKTSTPKPAGTALLINPLDPKSTAHRIQVRERSPTPPPSSARTLIFQFEVEDSGPGIAESMQAKVFEPFVQGDLGLSKKYGGTGLGLSICSQLAGLMGGSISLVSSEGKGSTFTMIVPLKHTKSRAPSTASSEIHGSRPGSISNGTLADDIGSRVAAKGESSPQRGFDKDAQPRLVGLSQPFFAAAPSPSPGSESKDQLSMLDSVAAAKDGTTKLRILVAEDNLVNQEVVLRMLKLEDVVDVVVAKDGQEAYDIVKQSMSDGKFFDLILMDVQMPRLDGLESTRLIRKMGYSAPIVALTAFAEESNVRDCYDSGMDHFLSKPIRRPALKQVLKKFATIPEENETSSLTSKGTHPKPDSSSSSAPDDPVILPVNGTRIPATP